MAHRDEFEMALRVEQQTEQFAGKPTHMSVHGSKINTSRDNPELQPTRAESVRLSEAEMEEIIRQEWQTEMTRSVVEARLNRHGSKDGPVVRRSASGVVYASAQPAPGEPFVLDAIATPPRRKK